jgi:two-component system sensor histidine kinase HydH
MLNEQGRPLLSEEIDPQDKIDLDSGLVIPCFGKDGLLAIIFLGAKANSQMYTSDDILAFENLSYDASFAIENCTYWKEIEERQRQARMAEMDLFSYSVAHEIDNPMSIIKGNAEYLRRHFFKGLNLNEEQQKDADEVVNAILGAQIRVTGMIKAIEEFGKKIPSEMAPFKFSDVLNHYFNLYGPILKNHHIPLTKELPQEELPYVRGHLQELMQVLAIFSQNSMHALNYAPEKKVRLKVEIINSDWIRVSFSDTGYGIEKEKLSAIFSAFVTTKASSEGTGMGLYNAKRFIIKHKGRIWAESEGKGKGATLIFEVPIAKDVTEEEIRKSEEDKGNRKF